MYFDSRRYDQASAHVSAALLDLHYICLRQADVLGIIKSSGAVLLSIGGSVPLQSMMNVIEAAGYSGRVVSLSWKVQSEPVTIIGEYARNQRRGLGEFYFYPMSALAMVFGNMSPAAAGLRAEQIEEELSH